LRRSIFLYMGKSILRMDFKAVVCLIPFLYAPTIIRFGGLLIIDNIFPRNTF
jgi:hypothetical protein